MLYFLLSTLVLTLYIDVVLSLSINIKWFAEMSQIPHAILSVHYLQFQKVTHFRPKHAKPRPCYTAHKKSTVEDAIWFQEIKFRPMPWRILNTVCIAEVALCVTLLFKSSSLNLLKQLINKLPARNPFLLSQIWTWASIYETLVPVTGIYGRQ